jgi:hypothetical protein
MNDTAPSLSFSHMGLSVRDLAPMKGFYEAFAPLGLPDPEPHCAECYGWSSRVLRAIGIGRVLGL